MSNIELLEQCERVVAMKINYCKELLSPIEEDTSHLKAFKIKSMFDESETDNWLFTVWLEKKYVEDTRCIIKQLEELKTVIENKIKSIS